MSYQVLARSWRPQRFDDLIGQDAVVRTLKNALSSDTLGHAYLFAGLRGVGKTTVARLLAKAVNCSEGPTADPCGKCTSCDEIAAASSLDVVELDGASNRGIDDVRELRELLRFRPVRDRFRVIIVDEVHMLTREAFNALLKSLEEPPPYILFVFATTERHRVPATILSRCQQLDFRPVATAQISARLSHVAEKEGFELSNGAAALIARSAGGSVRDALSLLDQLRAFASDHIDEEAVGSVLGVPRFEQVAELVAHLVEGRAAEGMAILKDQLKSGHDATVIFQETGRFLSTLLQVAVEPSQIDDLERKQLELVEGLASRLGLTGLTRMLGLWVEQERLLRDAANRELALQVACLRLGRWPAVRQMEALLEGSEPPPSVDDGKRRGRGVSGPPKAVKKACDARCQISPNEALRADLWEHAPQLAGAMENAAVEQHGENLVIRLSERNQQLATFLDSPQSHERLLDVGRRHFPRVARVCVEAEQSVHTPSVTTDLQHEAENDPTVALVQQILGGEIVHVEADRDERELGSGNGV
jgi:DNA polymerase-3 subunit gamma/tau